MGQSKNAEEIAFMADILKGFDVVAIQEIVAGVGGAQSIARLADALNRTGTKWEYKISAPTLSDPHSAERYAFLWKTSQVKLVKPPKLDEFYQSEIEREPYLADFSYNGEIFTLVNFHAIPKKKQPETEIKYFKYFPDLYPNKNLIFLGDFNTPQSHSVFLPLKKMGFSPIFQNQKTSLRTKCINANCLASEYDNIFYNSAKNETVGIGVVHFYTAFSTLKEARKISDHIPIWIEFSPCE